MEFIDYYNPHDDNDSFNSRLEKTNLLEESKAIDRGYSKIYRYVENNRGDLKRVKIEIYTSGDMGSNIRDAESGDYYKYKVGSLDEDLFFKVALATGECKSSNGSNILFYTSPNHFMNHLNEEISGEIIGKWQEKHDKRLKIVESMKKPRTSLVTVK
jgi:hypothetical protein